MAAGTMAQCHADWAGNCKFAAVAEAKRCGRRARGCDNAPNGGRLTHDEFTLPRVARAVDLLRVESPPTSGLHDSAQAGSTNSGPGAPMRRSSLRLVGRWNVRREFPGQGYREFRREVATVTVSPLLAGPNRANGWIQVDRRGVVDAT